MEKGFSRGSVNTTLFLKKHKHDMLMAQIYVDDIIFDTTNQSLCEHFAKEIQSEFCHNDFQPRLGRPQKSKWSRHRSFLYGCDRSPGCMFLN